ncbi:glycoside hydrolase family 2 protein [Metabacillus arenae]|nr:sugar-binding domain-containing protein [Metabacillus arenae]
MKNNKNYPRPQFFRKEWQNLNGEWEFVFDDQNVGKKSKWFDSFPGNQKITVPFTYETKASGVGEEAFHPCVWYKSSISIDKRYKDQKKKILHFEGADYLTEVWVNGQFVGRHEGGYSRFSFDVTNFLLTDSENSLVVRVEDSISTFQPRGKQRWLDENFGCWYVQTTGIWKTVWLEYLEDETHLGCIKLTPEIDNHSLLMGYEMEGVNVGEDLTLVAKVSFKDQPIREVSLKVNRSHDQVKIKIDHEFEAWKVKFWSPENPNLYDLELLLYKGERKIDHVYSYFGMRKISIENGKVLLNNTPIYQKLILDQGYWDETHLTPPSEEALIKDIDSIIAMGYNGVRKHQKIEDERFLYWCDVKGLFVWSEMASAYEFGDKAIEKFTNEWIEVVKQNYNHPSIVTWVPFNESWGISAIFVNAQQQFFTESVYNLTKAIDPMRPVIVNDGWEHTVSDIITLHDYEADGDNLLDRYEVKESILQNKIPFNQHKYAFAKGYSYKGQPVIISEYGGIAFKSEQGWGYGAQVSSIEDFLSRFQKVTDSIKKLDWVSGYCYTQITDVQQEINGFLKENREPKMELNKIKEINDKRI